MSKLFVKTWLATANLADRARREEGQAITEYALILGLIVVGAITVLALIGPTNVNNAIK
jgi:Flp pilus assembly pilin Flp